jgi:hypothetical protein
MSDTSMRIVVADERRVGVLVEVGVDLEGAGVQAGLVREGAGADVGLAAVGRHVGDLADGVRDPGGLAQPLRLEQRHTLLDLQVGDDGEDVGVAGALAVAVDRPLHVGGARRRPRPSSWRRRTRCRCGSGCPRAHPWSRGRRARRRRPGRAASPVGVAQRERPRRRTRPRPDALQGVGPVESVAVEEVLGVEEHPAALTAQEGHRVADHLEVLLEGGPQRQLDVAGMRLGDQGDDRGPESSRARTSGSAAAVDPARRVAPNAASVALRRSTTPAAARRRTPCPWGWRPASRPR